MLKGFHLEFNQMLGDFFTKLHQGKKFTDFRKLILGISDVESYAEGIGAQ